MTDTIFTEPVRTTSDPDTGRGRRGALRALIALAVVAPLAASITYGVNQHQHAAALTVQRDDARSTLHATRGTLHDTLHQLHSTQDVLATAQDQLTVCSSVGKATLELFDSADSLNTALLSVLNGDYGTSDITDASGNIDKVTSLVDDAGFDNIQDFVAACTDGGTGESI